MKGISFVLLRYSLKSFEKQPSKVVTIVSELLVNGESCLGMRFQRCLDRG